MVVTSKLAYREDQTSAVIKRWKRRPMYDGNGVDDMDKHEVVFPLARFDNLIVNDVDEGVLLYDESTHTIHQLNTVSRDVWRAATGETTIAGIAHNTGLTVDMVQMALAKLADCGLLHDPTSAELLPPRQSRRALMRKAAATAAIPVIVSVSAPLAARAASPGTVTMTCGLIVPGCSNFAVCCTSYCRGNGWEISSASLINCSDNGNGDYAASLSCTCRLP